MGKKVGKRLYRLIKVLRTKVYITDSSSFKQLVKELTGYQSRITDIPVEVVKASVMENIEIAGLAISATSLDSFETFEQAFQLEEIRKRPDAGGRPGHVDVRSHAFVNKPRTYPGFLMPMIMSRILGTLIEQETSLFDYELLY
ncbi:hypothetical protein V6N13_140503 [Hibiscus sabdariffa]